MKTFKNMDAKNIVEKLECPNLLFGIENKKIIVSVNYMMQMLSD
jgi:hypothetical protein